MQISTRSWASRACRTSAAGLLLSTSLFAQNPVVPPEPAIWREVTGIIDYGNAPPPNSIPRFQRPHVPGVRTTADGRLGVFVNSGTTPEFTLLRPEQLISPVPLQPPLASVTDDAYSFVLSTRTRFQYSHPGASSDAESGIKGFTTLQWSQSLQWQVAHVALWEDAPPVSNGGKDEYSLKVLVTVNNTQNGPSNPRRTQFFTTPVKVVVGDPKTPQAAIVSVTVTGPAVESGVLPYVASGFEPVICGDGRLLVLRVAAENMTWTDPNTGVTHNNVGQRDMAYAYYETGAVADASKWGKVIPISFAPYDLRINKKFGFAMNPFRDAEGKPILAGEEFGASYPWIDRDAKNLFFASIHDRLRENGQTNPNGRYTSGQAMVVDPVNNMLRPDPFFTNDTFDNTQNHMGVSFAGLWSRGKVVLVDNLLNNMDFQIVNRAPANSQPSLWAQMRNVHLFQDDNDPQTEYDGWIRLGYGRANGWMPPGENGNTNIVDSPENKLNLNKHARPITLRDIVWTGSVGQQTDEIVFDDYLDPDALIIAHMNGLLTWEQGVPLDPVHESTFKHHSGWNESLKIWSGAVKLQNAATDDGTHWIVPAHGLASSGVRLEPAAVGGIVGKGLWLDGDERVTFAVPAQTRTGLANRDWYVGLFLDARFANDANERRILTFPDGTALSVLGRRQLIYRDNGIVVHRVTLPTGATELMPAGAWCHVALQIRDSRHTVDLHLNGMLYDRWHGDQQLFSAVGTLTSTGSLGGDFIVGAPAGTTGAFAGWVDELRVIAHTLDLETACNQAGGTLCGVPAGTTGQWANEADLFPQWVHAEYAAWLRNHGEDAEPRFVSFHDYSGDRTVHRVSIPAALEWRRESVLFPEGPLFENAPRPESRHNRFCASCHFHGGQEGLSDLALQWTSTPAKFDPRRQPSQPPAWLHGVVPPGIVTATARAGQQPPTSPNGTGPWPVDEYMLETYASSASIRSFTLVDNMTGRDLAEIPVGGLTNVDPVLLGTTSFRIRANLDSDQGHVHWIWNGVAQPDTLTAPHVMFASGITLNMGTYVLRATADDGVQAVAAIAFADTTTNAPARVIADYRDDFRAGTPKPGWSYAWNSLGPIASGSSSLQRLAWSPATGAYTSLGFNPNSTDPGRFVQCHATGGYPGGGMIQTGQQWNHYSVATYEIPFDGDYEVVNGWIQVANGSSNGVWLWMGIETSAGVMVGTGTITALAGPVVPFTSALVQSGPIHLNAGDRIHIGVGPRGNDTSDAYTLDYSIRFVP